MSSNPLFSVLIANFNNAQYLEEAIQSVISQSYSNWEIVIVDDGSTDSSKHVYDLHSSDQRIHVHYNDCNHGCGYSKRKCVSLAQGNICGFLDADDVLLPNALELMVSTHLSHPDISLVLSRFYYCDAEMNVLCESRKLVILDGLDYFTMRDYQPEHFASFKKGCYLKTSGISADKPRAIDQELYFKLEEVSPCFVLPDITYKYRVYSESISHGDNSMSAYVWNIIVRYETCVRRHLDYSSYSIGDLENKLNWYKSRLEHVYKSKQYKVGSFILKPFSRIHALFSRNH